MARDHQIFEGENYHETLNKALEHLNLKEDQVEVEILEEKKGSLFRKGFTKLKIVPKDNHQTAVTVSEDDLNLQLDKILTTDRNNEENRYFTIDFKEDGIYLTVNHGSNKKAREEVDDILDFIKSKAIEGFDLINITSAINEKQKSFIIAPPQDEKIIDSTAKFEISKNKMEAKILLTEPIGGKFFTLETLKEAINEHGITYGVQYNQLENMVNGKITETFLKIAIGKEPVNGIDGKIAHYFKTSKDYKPILLEDGSVDFKTLDIVSNVNKGQLLAEAIPPTPGVEGYDVFGNVIKPKAGRDFKLRGGKNTVTSADGLKLYSTIEGEALILDGKIVVNEVYTIHNDVDNSTGNITFNGSINVRGNVKAGFTIKAEGNIEVHGVVEGANLYAKGDIILNRGVQGSNQCYLECEGNLFAKYIESANINVHGNVESDCILHSNVYAKGKILVIGKKGLMVGGEIKAGDEIRAKTLGSHMGTQTKLEVGIDPEEKAKYDEVRHLIQETERNMDHLKKTIDLLSRAAKSNQLPKSKEEIFVKSIKTYEFLKDKLQKLKEEELVLETKIQAMDRGKIHISGTIYPGVKVTILNSSRHINDELSHSTLFRKDGDVRIGPYEN
ncbi:FapA family protein [Alkaliphilus serpentinus]|nr:FapA family protein [Alkaliphilus serpentinus]